jgi:hypothetical protein
MTPSSPGRGGGPAEGWWRGLCASHRPPSTIWLRQPVPGVGLAMPRMAEDRPGNDSTRHSVPGRIA